MRDVWHHPLLLGISTVCRVAALDCARGHIVGAYEGLKPVGRYPPMSDLRSIRFEAG